MSKRRYAYLWADGIYSKVRMDDKLCLSVAVDADDTGRKEILTIADGNRESKQGYSGIVNLAT